jgi:hypothetical protein
MLAPTVVSGRRDPWNKGKLVGQKSSLKLRDIWALANAAATKLMAPLVQKDASRQVEGLIRTIDDRPACRSSPQYILARGRSAGFSPARRCTFRHLAATAVCPKVEKSDAWPRQTAPCMQWLDRHGSVVRRLQGEFMCSCGRSADRRY